MILDLSLRLSRDTLLYPGDSPPEIRRLSDLDAGDLLTSSHVSLGCHVGTHVDAPAHFLRGGATLDQLPLKAFYGPALVLDLSARRCIERRDLESLCIPQRHHLLLKTENSALLEAPSFSHEYCWLEPDAAQLLAERQPLSVGFDYYSLDPVPAVNAAKPFPAHLALARAGVPVFVCLALSAVRPGEYTFSGLPLPLVGAEGSPVRAVLISSPSR